TLIPPDITTDERGLVFARVYGPAVDIGAFEAQPLATTTAVTTSATTSTYGDLVTFTATVTGPTAPAGSVRFVIDGAPGFSGQTPLAVTGTTSTWALKTALGAGTHTVEADFVGVGGFTDSNATLSGGVVVKKADAKVVVTPYTVTYNGAAH